MALQIQYTAPEYGVTAPVAYAKIDNFRGTISIVYFNVYIYSTQVARSEGKQPIGYFEFSVPYSDNMTYANVYSYLKTLSGFENAVDC